MNEYDYKFVQDYPGVSRAKDWRTNPSSSNRGAVDRSRNWHLLLWRNRSPKALTFHGPANYFTVKRAKPRGLLRRIPQNPGAPSLR
jgi:hypothetical protein